MKNALVTGASQGLGKAVAQQLIVDGYNVFIASRDAAKLQTTAKEIGATAIVCDVTSPDDITKLFSQIGAVDVLVCNAGGPTPGNFSDIDDAAWEQAFQLTFMSVVRLIRGALPHMQQQKWGRIICLTSTSVKEPIDNLIISNALRAAVTNLAKSVANEVAKGNITVNTVAPGMFATDRLNQLLQANPDMNARVAAIPFGRVGEPSEFAQAVSFLASDKASYVTGTEITVDGGLTHSI